jgi:hypothetical protein
MKILLELLDMVITLLFLATAIMGAFFVWADDIKREYKIAFTIVLYFMYWVASNNVHGYVSIWIKNLK